MGTIVKPHAHSDGAVARPDHVNENVDILYNEINGNLDFENLKAALQNAANGFVKLDADAKVPTDQLPESVAANVDIVDAGDLYTATEVEAALQEIAGAGRTAETVVANAAAIVVNAAAIVANAANIAINAGKIPSSNAVVKAWIQFNGVGAIAIKDSFNVSSIADIDTGKYTINWDTNFANANYAALVTQGRSTDMNECKITTAPLVGSITIFTRTSVGVAKDCDYVAAIAIGDQ